MLDDRFHRPCVVPAAVATLAALAVLVGAVVLMLSRCAPRPTPQASAPPAQATAIATSSAAVVATQSVRVTVRRATTGSQRPTAQAAQEGALNLGQVSQHQAKVANGGDFEEIVIELSQAVAAGAASVAIATASADHFGDATEMVPNHGRLGVALVTMPGVLAADVQLARVDVPPWLVGVPLEVGLDVVGNLEAGGAGVSVGGKGYALAGGWSRWDGREQGVMGGVGARF